MLRRQFLKYVSMPAFGWLALKLVGCGAKDSASSLHGDGTTLPESLRIWSYYVPLTKYEGVIEDFEGRDPLDLKIDFAKVSQRTSRISGNRNDGTNNRAELVVGELRDAETDYIRVPFWHDDEDPEGDAGHALHIFKRHLESLDAGEKLFIATGLHQQNHYHVVMIDPAG